MPVQTIDVRERVMARNDAIAADVRATLARAGVPAFNLVSSPGSGKTLLLERTLERLKESVRIAVVAGDVQTQNDADRLARHTGRVVHAVITGGACHLDAAQVRAAVEALDLEDVDLLLIENVGNLVCPAAWDLGEQAKIVLFAVTEGEDKPLKYPRMFREARYVVMTKLDLLPHVPFNLDDAVRHALRINPDLHFFSTSAVTGHGLGPWCTFLAEQARERVRI
ncbi:MAG TPA: hydrogenase nickel incorporation protein HypB [Gemmatimonadales bacterium]|nr:hydrogenase nickel incorporation protein HypB [Gemmatimonadales bacterium]